MRTSAHQSTRCMATRLISLFTETSLVVGLLPSLAWLKISFSAYSTAPIHRQSARPTRDRVQRRNQPQTEM